MSALKIEEALKTQGKCVFPVKGTSMLPLLHKERDTVVIVPVNGRLKKYDVALYKAGENYVLHRVIRVKKDYYVIRGDNCIEREKVPFESVIGVAEGFYIDGKYLSVTDREYILYSKKRCNSFWYRSLKRKAVYGAKRIFKK